jgi:putative flippase GtrA
MNTADIRALKQRLAPRLLDIAGVSGVGIREGTLAVYMEVDSKPVRQAVANVIATEAPNVSVAYVITGPFRAQ